MHPWRGRSRPAQADLPLRDPDATLGERHPQLIACESFLRRPVRRFDGVPASSEAAPTSVWGKGWIAHLEDQLNLGKALKDGETYWKNGLIWHLEVDRGEIRSIVLGAQLYAQTISIQPLSLEDESRLIEICSGTVSTAEELLKARVSDTVLEAFLSPERGIFPDAKLIKSSCMCSAEEPVCKHAAAVLYGFGLRLDEEPELLFRLRGTDPEVLKGLLPAGLRKPAVPAELQIPNEEIANIFDLRLERPSAVSQPLQTVTTEDPLSQFVEKPDTGRAAGVSKVVEPQPPAPPPPRAPQSVDSGSWLDDDWEEEDEEDETDPEIFGGSGPSPLSMASNDEGEDVLEIGRADLLELGIASHRIQRWLAEGTLVRTPKRGRYQLTPQAWSEIEPLLPSD